MPLLNIIDRDRGRPIDSTLLHTCSLPVGTPDDPIQALLTPSGLPLQLPAGCRRTLTGDPQGSTTHVMAQFDMDQQRPGEVDASTLSHEEWFFIMAHKGCAPNALPADASEFRRRVLGMARKEQMAILTQGLESLIARGFVTPDYDAEGQPLRDADGDITYRVTGRLVFRLRELNLKGSIS